jgi:hypothetical protein
MTKSLATQGRPQQLLTRILDQPQVVSVIQSLDARVLHRVIDHVGLEDAGELVALATTEQLRGIFDEDLWRSERPGQDERFDADRFALWLEILMETGPAFAAEKLVELDEDLVTLGLHRLVLVIDMDALAVTMAGTEQDDDAILTEKALESCLSQELEEFRIIARDPDHWDPIIGVLLELDRNHHATLRRLLERCCQIAAEQIEDNGGLYQVLTSDEALAGDVAALREDRRSEAGFIAPSSAAAFLALGRATPPAQVLAESAPDPVTRAYFRSLGVPRSDAPKAAPRAPAAGTEALVDLLRAADVLPEAPLPALGSASADVPLFQLTITELRDSDPASHAERLKEVSYLANVLVAGASCEGRALRPLEAAEATIATCNLGLEGLVAQDPSRARLETTRHGAVKLFRLGWQRLFTEVSLVAADTLGAQLDRLLADPAHANRLLADPARATDAIKRLRAELGRHRAAGKPWLVRPRLLVLQGLLPPQQLAVLQAALDECPARPGPLFIATGAELRAVQTAIKAGGAG